MSLVFIGTPAFAVPSLRRLAAAGHEISAVVTQPDRPKGRGRHPAPSPVKVAAVELGLPVIQPESLRDANSVDRLRRLSPELMVAVAYGQILRPNVLEIPERGVLNVHPSLLPLYRGASPIPAAILAGDAETGVTIMLMNEGMDTGPVLAQTRVPISPHDTAGSLAESLADLGAELLVKTARDWLDGTVTPQPQDASLATVTRPLKKEDGGIDWSLPAVEIWRRVRAYDPWPGAYTALGGELVHIWSAWPIETDSGAGPGVVVTVPPAAPVEAEAASFAVQTGSGLLAVLEAQRSGRKRLPSEELLRGMPGLIGKRLRSL
jgi:methionyl-tRNA formyltransferase